MNKYITISSLATTVMFAGLISVSAAEENHGQEAIQHLEQATESGKKGADEEAGKHVEEAKQHMIQQNKKHPYKRSPKRVTGENMKQQHDEKAFSDVEKAKGHAEKAHAGEAGEAAGKAEEHLKDKEISK